MVRAPVMNLSTRERVCPVIQAALRTAKEGDRSNVLGFRGASATAVPERCGTSLLSSQFGS
jgi:hypothetical protein